MTREFFNIANCLCLASTINISLESLQRQCVRQNVCASYSPSSEGAYETSLRYGSRIQSCLLPDVLHPDVEITCSIQDLRQSLVFAMISTRSCLGGCNIAPADNNVRVGQNRNAHRD